MSVAGNTETYSPRFRELMKLRGMDSDEAVHDFLHNGLENLHDPFLMLGMEDARDRVLQAIKSKEKIIVHGDYDADGVTGAAVIARTLQVLGAQFEVFLPDRAEDGYGVSKRAIEEAPSRGFSLLITVDCGIAAGPRIQDARDGGLDVIIIDHHKIPADGLPPANIILNPLQEDCPYPCKDLSAAGLAFKLSQALLGDKALAFLDLAAVSTVCDVAPLMNENRLLVKNGLKLLTEGVNPGFRALAEKSRLRGREINVGHIGFVFGPRINAAGRMSSPDIALRLLLTDHAKEAESLATILDEENKSRQKEERLNLREAIREVERVMNFNRDRVIVVGRRGWHAGVIGIVAARLVEKYHRPAIVIAIEGDKGKGSARSIKSFNLYDAMDSCRELFQEFGGHPQAAGLSMDPEKIDAFRKKINDYCRDNIDPAVFVRKVKAEMEIELADLSSLFVRELELMEPHGMGNPRPVFMTRNLEIKTNPVSLSATRYQFYVTDGLTASECIWSDRSFEEKTLAPEWMHKGTKLDLVYTVRLKRWQGHEVLSLDVKDIRPI